MRLSFGAVATALLSLANAAAISLVNARSNSCGTFTGEVIHLSLVIIEKPVVYQSYITENMYITIEESITIWINNAPTHLTTTVSVTSTSTSTTTLSTATVTYTPPAVTETVDPISSGNSSPAQTGAAAGGSETTSATKATATGEDAAGKGINTSLYTATSTYTHIHPATSTAVSTYVFANSTTTSATTITTATAPAATSLASGEYTDWTVFKANGVNLGGWLEVEISNQPDFFAEYAPSNSSFDITDEWTLCKALGSRCGPVMEGRYATFVTTATIDKLASVGVDTIRVPTTYQAWIDFPGSALYHGDQQKYLQAISKYAIETYGMRVILDIHSLPGGTNGYGHGEADGHEAWWFNETNLEWSYKAVDAALTFIQASGNPWAWTLAPINEPSDNHDAFATPAGITTKGRAWLVQYFQGVIAHVTAVNAAIPVMLQDGFLGEETWSPYFALGTNIVIDTHVYYFTSDGVYPAYVGPAICGQATVLGGDGKFPVFIGEWSLQLQYNNTLSERERIFNTQRYAWNKYAAGSTFWAINHTGQDAVNGEGELRDYWSYSRLMDQGIIKAPVANATYC